MNEKKLREIAEELFSLICGFEVMPSSRFDYNEAIDIIVDLLCEKFGVVIGE